MNNKAIKKNISTKVIGTVFLSIGCLLYNFNVQAQSQKTTMSRVEIDRYEQVRDNRKELKELAQEKRGTRLGATAQNRLGYLAYDQGNLEEAKMEYLETYRNYQNIPELASARLHLGKIHYKQRDYENARTYFNELATSRQPDRAEWGRYYLARTLRALNDPGTEQAIQAYFTTSREETADKDVIVQNELERYYSQNRQFEKAIQAAQTLMDQYPNTKYTPMNEAKIVDLHIALGQTDQAIAQCKAIIEKYGASGFNAARAQNSLAGTLAGRGDFEQAREEYKKVALNYPLEQRWVNAAAYGEANLDMREGMIKQDSALISHAEEAFWNLHQNFPEDRHVPRAMMNAALISQQHQAYEEALKAYDIILDFDPDLIDKVKPGGHSNDLDGHRQLVRRARLSKARLLRDEMDKPELALEEYEQMLIEDAKDTEALLGKARSLHRLNRIEESREILIPLTEKDSDYQEIAQSLLNALEPMTQSGENR